MEITIKINGHMVSVEVSDEVAECYDQGRRKAENLSHEKRRHWDEREFDEYIGSTEKVEIGEYMQGNYNIYAKKPCRIRKCAPIRYFNDADHSLVMQYIHAGSTCAAPQNRHFCV